MKLKEDEISGYLEWTEGKIKQYYLENLLLHDVGHSIDSFYKRYRSRIFTSEAALLIFELP